MYLHITVCNILFFYLSMISTHFTTLNSVRMEGKGKQDGKKQTPYLLQADVGHRQDS